MPTKKFINVHPGEVLREEFMKPLELSAYRIAKDAGLPIARVHEILHERRGITAETDLRLSRYFRVSPGYWLRLQATYEIRDAQHRIGSKVESEVTPCAALSAA
jgi:antitoxin HigA-1